MFLFPSGLQGMFPKDTEDLCGYFLEGFHDVPFHFRDVGEDLLETQKPQVLLDTL